MLTFQNDKKPWCRYLPKMLRDSSKLNLRRSSQSITDG
jgi:hypothetical protein